MSQGSDGGSGEGMATELDRDIGVVGAVALGVGTMIAAGIFVLSGLAVSNVGAMAIVAFVIAAVVASFTAFAYAEFATIYPESGGGYAYVSNTFDTDLTYIVGWSMILGYPASAAFYLASFSDWFYRFIAPLFDLQAATPYWLSGLVILSLLVVLNLKGTEESGKFQIVITALKVLLIGVFLFGGLQAFQADTIQQSFAENLTQFRQIGLTSALVFITFFGFEAIATNAEEIEDPGRTIPRAIFFSMGFVTVVYTLVVLVVVLAINDANFLEFLRAEANLAGLAPERFVEENGEIAMGRAAQYYLGPVGFYVIIVGALFSMLSAANATVLAGSRVKLAMSRRDHLPGRFENLHPSLNTPYNSVLLTGGFIFLFIFLFTVVFGGGPGSEAVLELPVTVPLVGSSLHLGIEAIAHFADFMLLTGLIVVNLAVLQSRRKFPDLDRSFEVPGVPVVPIVAVLANLVLLVNVEPSSFLLGLLAELVGVVVWFGFVGKTTAADIEKETPTVVSERHPEKRSFTVLVPIANPANAAQLMRTARDVAADRDGEIMVTSVVSLPDQTPLSEGYQYVDEKRQVLERATATEDDRDVPVNGTIKIGHDVGTAILHTIDQYDCDAVLLGWKGRGDRRRDVVLGTTVDEVVRRANCDVYVERFGTEQGPVESILVPTAGGPHASAAAEVARAIARANDSRVQVVNVVAPDASEERRQDGERAIERVLEVLGDEIEVTTDLIEADDVVDGIVSVSNEHDLTIVGATQEGLFQRLVFGTVPEAVGRRAADTVIMTKRYRGLTSRFRRVLGSE